MGEIQVATAADLDVQVRAPFVGEWPEFIFHNPTSAMYIDRVRRYFHRFNVRLLADGEIIAGGWGVLLEWNGSVAALPGGYDAAMVAAVTGYEQGITPDTLCVMAAAVKPDRFGRGMGSRVLTALRERAEEAGLRRMISPVRPTLKKRYPLTPMEQFARWTRSDGQHLDPWIRTHQRLGASILTPAAGSLIVTGSVAEWEDWARMAFPETGQYIVPDALDLVAIDREADRGTYEETNLWMQHA